MNKTYICADIHGDLAGYKELLNLIDFDDTDRMIIAGDVLDRGKYGIELLELVLSQSNVSLLLGNHEMFAIMYLSGELSQDDWIRFGGQDTLSGILKMNQSQKDKLLHELCGLPLYTEIKSPVYGNTVVTHTGIDLDNLVYVHDDVIDVKESIKAGFERNTYNFMCGRDIHYAPTEILKRLNQYIILGHVPTYYINDDYSCNAYRSDYYMDIDCGNGKKRNGGRICCYDVNDDIYIYCKQS